MLIVERSVDVHRAAQHPDTTTNPHIA